METLKTSVIVLLMTMVFSVNTLFAQTYGEIQNAFKLSYANEYKADYSSAIINLQKVYKENSYECNLRLGWLHYLANKYEKSLDYYQKAIALKKYSVEARMGYIKPANMLKKYTDVYNKYEEILTIDPYNSVANYWVGVSYYNVKKYDIAAKYFELVVNMYPFDFDGNHMLGWTYLYLGRKSEAKILFEKALLYKPTDESSKSGLSKCN